MFFDPIYFLFVGPPMLLAMYASFLTKSRFQKYARVAPSSGLTGAQAAYQMLRREGLNDVGIEQTRGFLSDHYDPRSKVLRLSPDVYGGRSLSAVGVACHEAGHALQDAQNYAPLNLRSALVPMTTFSSRLSFPIIFVGLILGGAQSGPLGMSLIQLGIILFGITTLFTLVTLPVEWDASARAKRLMVKNGIVSPQQEGDAGAVLNAAFLTYLASAISSLMTLLYYLMRSGLLGGSRD